MASINQGDDAVERLDNAVTAFEQIMTGPEGQTVAVPGHQPQPTLAERVKQNLKPSTDAAAGFAAQASASAKAADESAKLASQISGLENVADAIGLAALPMPDVWAPLSDSLRLITGYGRDVLVGSDVVARMVNFSRNSTATYIGKDGQLKTAAANEPRFEREGLLLEGQSTNLVPWSSGYNGETPAWSATNYSMSKRPDGVLITPAAGVAEKCVKLGDNLFPDLPDRPLSMTVEVKGNGYDMVVLGFKSTYISAADNGIGVSLVDGKVKQTNHGLTVTRFEPLPDGFVRITVSTPSYTTTAAQWRSAVVGCGSMSAPYKAYSAHDADGVKGVIVRNIQLEALPFASSYIPTNGSAVTRAADVCWIPNALNVTPDYGDITITMEVRRNVAIPSSAFPRLIHISDRQFVVADSVRIMARGGGVEQVNISAPAPGTRERIAATIKGNTIACFLNGVKATLPQAPILPVSNGASCFIGSRNGLDGLFGHVRNVRIWQRTLSDDQIKAAA